MGRYEICRVIVMIPLSADRSWMIRGPAPVTSAEPTPPIPHRPGPAVTSASVMSGTNGQNSSA